MLKLLRRLFLLGFCFFSFVFAKAQSCNIEITLNSIQNYWGDRVFVKLIDGSNNVVLNTGDFGQAPFGAKYDYNGINPPYRLLVEIIDDTYRDNSLQFSVKVGGVQDIQGAVTSNAAGGFPVLQKFDKALTNAFTNCGTGMAMTTCPNGQDFLFFSQQDLNNFKNSYGNCSNIVLGNVYIGKNFDGFQPGAITATSTSDITDLSALYNVTKITGKLQIANNLKLTNINGLMNLTEIGGTLLEIKRNSLLSYCNNVAISKYLSKSATTYLRTITGNIGSCETETKVIATNGICPSGDFTFTTQKQIEDFGSKYAACTSITLGNVTIGGASGSTDIKDLRPLQKVTKLSGYLIIRGNRVLERLTGLENIKRINGVLSVQSNLLLADISALENINPSDISIGATTGLTIKDNPVLAVCNLSNFCTYLSVSSNPRTISGNKDFCLDESALASRCRIFGITPNEDNIVFVNNSVAGSSQKGDTWVNAVTDLADALLWAKKQYDSDNSIFTLKPLKVFVAKGIYKPIYRADNLLGINSKDRDNAFVLIPNVQLYGGFDPVASITNLTHKRISPTLNGSTLSGDIDGSNGLTNQDAYHVVVAAGNVGSALLDGFAIKGGYMDVADNNQNITVNETEVRKERGAAIAVSNSSPKINNIYITGNRAYAGTLGHSNSSPTYTNVLLSGNSTNYGAVYNNLSSPKFTNITISKNILTTTNNDGTAMRNITSHPKIYNSIIWGNKKSNDGINNIFNSGGASPTSVPEYYHSIVQGSSSGWSNFGTNGGGNLDSNPLFTNESNNDFSLQLTSPAIAKGNNAYFENVTATTTDIGGNPRVFSYATGGTIDIGAFERQDLLPQSITFSVLAAKNMSEGSFNLIASASSSLPLDFQSSNTAVATVSGNKVTLKQVGTTNITAQQIGNGDFATATPVVQELEVFSVLSVKLVSFNALIEGNGVRLYWQTSNERNHRGFAIHRSGSDQNFEKIGEIAANDNYAYLDKKPLDGPNYYKLVQIDTDGKESEIGITLFNFNLAKMNDKVYPNPTVNAVNIKFEAGKYQYVIITDVNGKMLETFVLSATATHHSIQLEKHPTGTYFLKLMGKTNETYKIIRN